MKWTLACSPTAWSQVSYYTMTIAKATFWIEELVEYCCPFLFLCVYLQGRILCSILQRVALRAAGPSPSPLHRRHRMTAVWPHLSCAMMSQPGSRPASNSSGRTSMSRGSHLAVLIYTRKNSTGNPLVLLLLFLTQTTAAEKAPVIRGQGFVISANNSMTVITVVFFNGSSAVPAPAVSAAAPVCVPQPALRGVDLKRLLDHRQPEVRPSILLILSTWWALLHNLKTACTAVWFWLNMNEWCIWWYWLMADKLTF